MNSQIPKYPGDIMPYLIDKDTGLIFVPTPLQGPSSYNVFYESKSGEVDHVMHIKEGELESLIAGENNLIPSSQDVSQESIKQSMVKLKQKRELGAHYFKESLKQAQSYPKRQYV